MSGKLYVVLGEHGEYSDRSVWVSGVFASREEAEAKMLERLAVNREFEMWQARYIKALQQIKGRGWWGIPSTDEEKAAAQAAAGPKPEYEPTERAEIEEVVVGEWRQSL
jgi:hypothetical protein